MESYPEEGFEDYTSLVADMKKHNFDVIRFASYRTACKLRFIQTRTYLDLIDIWNVIEAVRENALNTFEPRVEVNMSRVKDLCSTLYTQLNKRLPILRQVDVVKASALLVDYLMVTFEAEETAKLRILSVKVALSILCSGKTVDKLRYIFSLLADQSGLLIKQRFADFVSDALALPFSVFESPTFHYTHSLPSSIFDAQCKVTLNAFLEVLLSEPGPACLVWLPLIDRLAQVENVHHPVVCDACHRDGFNGFRYKCTRCYNVQLCQDCFWRGRLPTSSSGASHSLQHPIKEYSIYKSPTKQLGHSLRKSFRCVPDRGPGGTHPQFNVEATPERTLNLAHIVPPSPMQYHNGFGGAGDYSSLDRSSYSRRSPSATRRDRFGSMGAFESANNTTASSAAPARGRLYSSSRGSHSLPGSATGTLDLRHRSSGAPIGSDGGGVDDDFLTLSGADEHNLIARYAARLQEQQQELNAGSAPTVGRKMSPSLTRRRAGSLSSPPDASGMSISQQRQTIQQLEARNREIMREIVRLRHLNLLSPTSSSLVSGSGSSSETTSDPSAVALVSELGALRQRRSELEEHLNALQTNRHQLMLQLESLMRRLKTHQQTPSPQHSSPMSPSERGLLSPPRRAVPFSHHLSVGHLEEDNSIKFLTDSVFDTLTPDEQIEFLLSPRATPLGIPTIFSPSPSMMSMTNGRRASVGAVDDLTTHHPRPLAQYGGGSGVNALRPASSGGTLPAQQRKRRQLPQSRDLTSHSFGARDVTSFPVGPTSGSSSDADFGYGSDGVSGRIQVHRAEVYQQTNLDDDVDVNGTGAMRLDKTSKSEMSFSSVTAAGTSGSETEEGQSQMKSWGKENNGSTSTEETTPSTVREMPLHRPQLPVSGNNNNNVSSASNGMKSGGGGATRGGNNNNNNNNTTKGSPRMGVAARKSASAVSGSGVMQASSEDLPTGSVAEPQVSLPAYLQRFHRLTADTDYLLSSDGSTDPSPTPLSRTRTPQHPPGTITTPRLQPHSGVFSDGDVGYSSSAATSPRFLRRTSPPESSLVGDIRRSEDSFRDGISELARSSEERFLGEMRSSQDRYLGEGRFSDDRFHGEARTSEERFLGESRSSDERFLGDVRSSEDSFLRATRYSAEPQDLEDDGVSATSSSSYRAAAAPYTLERPPLFSGGSTTTSTISYPQRPFHHDDFQRPADREDLTGYIIRADDDYDSYDDDIGATSSGNEWERPQRNGEERSARWSTDR